MARLRRDRLTNQIGTNTGLRVDGSGINRGIKNDFSWVSPSKKEKAVCVGGIILPP